jgi:soluble lytic murein transglycosylase-like protein
MMGTIKYGINLLKSLFATRGSRRPGAPFAPVLAAVVLSTAAFYLPRLDRPETPVARDAAVEDMRQHATLVKSKLAGAEDLYEKEVAPLERVLLTYRDDKPLARRIAVSLLKEGRATGLEPQLLLAVLLVENPWLKPDTVSSVGALGLMQVMPLHRGQWKGCAPNLEEVEANICHGARIFASYLKAESGNIDRALLRYNGCVRGTNTPNCHFYPQHVYARAGRASLLAWKRSGAAGAP